MTCIQFLCLFSPDNFFCFLPILVWFQNDKIAQLLAAANVKISDNFGGLFAKASAGLDLKGLVSTISTSIGSGAYTQRNLFEILLNQPEIRLYLPFSDWFGSKLIGKW